MIALDCGPQIHVAAYHAEAKYNNNTPGIGALCDVEGTDFRLAAGVYVNSIKKQSTYAGASWQPVKLGQTKVGIYGGMVTGYNYSALPFAALAISVPVGPVEAHLIVVPAVENVNSAAASISISFKFN